MQQSDPVCQVVTTPQCSPTYRQQCTQTQVSHLSLYFVTSKILQVQQCSTVTQQECRTVDEGYYQTKCTTTTVTSLPIAPSTSTTTVTQGQAIQGTGDNCQYKWEGKGDNMRCLVNTEALCLVNTDHTLSDGSLSPVPAQKPAMELKEGSLDWVDSEEGPGLVSMPASTRASTLTLVLVSGLVLAASAEAMLGDSLLDPPEVMLPDLPGVM